MIKKLWSYYTTTYRKHGTAFLLGMVAHMAISDINSDKTNWTGILIITVFFILWTTMKVAEFHLDNKIKAQKEELELIRSKRV